MQVTVGSGDLGQVSAWPAFVTAHPVLIGGVEARLAAAGLPPLEWYDVLWALERAPRGRLRMYELADAVVITRSNLTRLVDRLEAAGLVTRDRSCADRRGAEAVVTEAGRSLRRKIWPVYSQAIEDLFEKHMSGAERQVMRRILLRLLAAARRQSDRTV